MNVFIFYQNTLDALVEIAGETLIKRQIRSLLDSGANKIGIGCKAGPEIERLSQELEEFNQVTIVAVDADLGSGGHLFSAAELFQEEFIYIDGRNYFEIDLPRFETFHHKHDAILTILVRNALGEDEPAIKLNPQGKVIEIDFEKGEDYFRSPARFGGVMFVSETLMQTFLCDAEPLDLFTEIIHPTFTTGDCYGYHSTEYIEDVHAFSKLEKDLSVGLPAQRKLSNKQKCIFLDRDGVLNYFGPYVVEPSILKVKECAAEAIRLINESGYLAIVITNQPIVAFGETDLLTLEQVHFKLHHILNQGGAVLDDLFFCPHYPSVNTEHPNMEYVKPCSCRKPGIGMLEKARERYNIDFASSWMIGDTAQDVQTGINAGVKTILVKGGNPEPFKKYGDARPDYVCEDVLDAVKNVILKP